MPDLNDISLFHRISAFESFSVAARVLGLPKSSISRSIGRLEEDLSIRLFERSTRSVRLTDIGRALLDRSAAGLEQLQASIDYAANLSSEPRGALRISAAIGFGADLLGRQLPAFLEAYPEIEVSVDLSAQPVNLIVDGIDLAVRMGELSDSGLVATKLGRMTRHLCASPGYLSAAGAPCSPEDLVNHRVVDMPNVEGRPRSWVLRRGDEQSRIDVQPKLTANDGAMLSCLISGGAGIGIVPGYLCASSLTNGTLAGVLPGWTVDDLDVNLVFPSRRTMPPTVRAFVDYMRQGNGPGVFWRRSPALSPSPLRADADGDVPAGRPATLAPADAPRAGGAPFD